MPVKFKVIERGQPGVSGGGDKKWYATPVSSGEKTLTDLTKDIEKISTVSGADIRAVLYALVDVMQSSLASGQIIRLGELGSLRVSFSSEGKATEKEVTANTIKQAKVIFTPAKGIKDTLATLTYEKA
ncbi:HU family DNA-binding protein [Riemerella anatipestifer]|uniref:HU family DNA-binding protein n=1 Tax=Riemerella anatipestifer TaxID=34085 RepID=UPI00129D4554|nr:HU family DNA-binding protein [Riemerella anatipestifer]MRM82505.1 DNA-binding protein [Riemerella anatipestifer]